MLSIVLLILLTNGVYIQCLHDSHVLNLYKHWTSGDGTYYGATQAGLCSLNVPNLPHAAKNVDELVALNRPQMFGSSSCGLCLRVNGSGQGLGNDPITGSFTAYVKDLCPECLAGSVDLAENGDGRWKVSIQAIQCPVGNSKIEYRLEGSNDWYIKLQVRNERMPTTKLEMLQPKSHLWVSLSRTTDGFWVFPSDPRVEKPIKRPFRLRLHAPNGKVLTDTVSPSSMGYQGVIHGSGVQYPLDNSLPH